MGWIDLIALVVVLPAMLIGAVIAAFLLFDHWRYHP